MPTPLPVPATGTPISNSAAAKQAFYDISADLGTKAGLGGLSRCGWLLEVAERGYRKEIDKDDLAPGSDAYHEARRKANVRGRENTGSDKEPRVSEAGNVLFVAQLPSINGLTAVMNIDAVINKRRDLKGEIAVLLIDGCKAQKLSPQALLSDAQIVDALTPAPKEDKIEADVLAGIDKRLTSAGEKFGWSPHIRAAQTSVRARMAEAGGTTAQQLAAAKATIKANKGKKGKK
jgi:hypothetical protein